MSTVHFSKIRFVLVQPSHPGNIGAAARAIKNMGFQRLYLVAPQAFPHMEATARAAGADDILTNAVMTQTLTEALTGCQLVFGSSARLRSLPWPILTAREAATRIQQEITDDSEIAVVFGQERTGLSNPDMEQCHYLLNIPCNPDFSSLNLAAAVQLVAYEIRMALLENPVTSAANIPEDYASAEEMAGFYEHLRDTLFAIEFLNPKSPKRLMSRLRRLFNRARPEKTEVNILRGILTSINKKL